MSNYEYQRIRSDGLAETTGHENTADDWRTDPLTTGSVLRRELDTLDPDAVAAQWAESDAGESNMLRCQVDDVDDPSGPFGDAAGSGWLCWPCYLAADNTDTDFGTPAVEGVPAHAAHSVTCVECGVEWNGQDAGGLTPDDPAAPKLTTPHPVGSGPFTGHLWRRARRDYPCQAGMSGAKRCGNTIGRGTLYLEGDLSREHYFAMYRYCPSCAGVEARDGIHELNGRD